MNRSTKLFSAVLVICASFQLVKFFLPSIFLKQFHLNSESFTQWSLLQALPSMYNYSNRAWISPYPYDPFTVQEIVDNELEHEGIQMNHYPVRIFTFRLDREKIFEGKVKTVYVRSVFGRETRISAYEVDVVDGRAKVTLRETHVK